MGSTNNIALFSGWHDLTMDAKGRVPVPAAFRKGLAERSEEQITLTIAPDKCLRGYTAEGLSRMLLRIEEQREKNPELGRRLKRQVISQLAELSFDSQGRVLVPQKLRERAALDSEVVYIGCDDYFELWNKDLWEADSRIDQDMLENNSAAMSAVFG